MYLSVPVWTSGKKLRAVVASATKPDGGLQRNRGIHVCHGIVQCLCFSRDFESRNRTGRAGDHSQYPAEIAAHITTKNAAAATMLDRILIPTSAGELLNPHLHASHARQWAD
ncbi:hypothetical protein ACLOJK_032139 [Asimina triloba]